MYHARYTRGALLSFVTVLRNFGPCTIDLSNSDLADPCLALTFTLPSVGGTGPALGGGGGGALWAVDGVPRSRLSDLGGIAGFCGIDGF